MEPITMLFVILVLFNLIDLGTTIMIVLHGGKETNPVVRWVMQRLGPVPGLVVVKAIGLVAVWYIVHYMTQLVAFWFLVVTIIGYMILCLANGRQLLK
jgi:hypothetical protein